jgi:hypothetical protein
MKEVWKEKLAALAQSDCKVTVHNLPDEIVEEIYSYTEESHFQNIESSLQKLIEGGSRATIQDLVKQPKLNGLEVKVLKWEDKIQRWSVRLVGQKKRVSIKPQNLIPVLKQQAILEQRDFIIGVRRQLIENVNQYESQGFWHIIEYGYVKCPLLIIHRPIEDESTPGPPLRLAEFARQIRRRLDECGGSYCDAIADMKEYIRESSKKSDEPKGPNKEQAAADLILPDKAAVRWFLLYAQLDSKKWSGALDTLTYIFADISSDQWPFFFTTEALYLKALVSFGLENHHECTQALKSYHQLAHYYDHHQHDAAMLSLWATRATPQTFMEVYNDDRWDDLYAHWDAETSSRDCYPCYTVAERLKVTDYDHPHQEIFDHYQIMKNNPDEYRNLRVPETLEHVKNILDEVTTRFRNKEEEEGFCQGCGGHYDDSDGEEDEDEFDQHDFEIDSEEEEDELDPDEGDDDGDSDGLVSITQIFTSMYQDVCELTHDKTEEELEDIIENLDQFLFQRNMERFVSGSMRNNSDGSEEEDDE